MSSKLGIYCDAIMEACWLAAAAVIPLFFNISSTRIFELDKALILRFLVILASAAGLLKWIDRRMSATAASSRAEQNSWAFKHPLVVSVFALAAIYILSSFLSITPTQSWWGSTIRSQGGITFCCYVLLFFVVLSELRTSEQLKRLQYTIMLTSIPISAYTILQFAGLDPIPWRDSVQGRSSGSMGNPIFLGGYLVMVIPITFGRLVEAVKTWLAEKSNKPAFILAAGCGIAIMIQAVALLCTQSRGPMVGLVASIYSCIFLFLVLKRSTGKSRSVFPVAAAGIGVAVPVLLILVIRIASSLPAGMALLCLGAAILLISALYIALWFAAWSRNWLWLTWFVQTVAIGLAVAAGPGRVVGERAQSFPFLGRLVQVSDQSAGARQLLWKTGLIGLRSGAPAVLPNDTKDGAHFFRPAIGYGPESIRFFVNLYGMPELQLNYVSEADRMHNETFDNLITIGFSGTLLFLFVFAAAIFHSLRYLGLINGLFRTLLFAFFLTLGCGAGIFVPWFAGVPHFAGFGVQAGMIAGLFAYIAWIGFSRREEPFSGDSRRIMVMGILGALIAHFVEISLCIAVTPTRTYFFLLLGVLAVLTSNKVKEGEPVKQRGTKLAFPPPLAPMPFIAAASFVVISLAWCFVVNTTVEHSAWKLFLNTWLVPSGVQGIRFPLTDPLILLILTFAGSIGLLPVEKPDSKKAFRFFLPVVKIAFGFLGFVWLVFGFLSALFWAALDSSASSPINESLHAEARMTLYFIGLLVVLGATAWSLVSAQSRRHAASTAIRAPIWGMGFLLAIGAAVGILNLTIYPAWADIASHIGHAYENSNKLESALPVYERAVKLAPDNASYNISLGLAQALTSASSGQVAAESVQSLKHALDLNPLDPTTFRVFGGLYTQSGERSKDPAFRDVQIQRAIPYFESAIRLAPSSSEAYNELGRCYALLGAFAKAKSLFETSMRLYPEDAKTYLFLGEMYFIQKDMERALQSYTQSANMGGGFEAQKRIGLMLALMGRREEAIQADLNALPLAPRDSQLLQNLAVLYFSLGDVTSGMVYAHKAYEALPDSGTINEKTFIMMLGDQAEKLLAQTK